MTEQSPLFGAIDLLPLWALLLVLLALAGELGYRLERRPGVRRTLSEAQRSGISTVTASMFALLAFTLDLTINFAQGRFEARRDLVVQEASSIGTAWLRTRLIGDPEGSAIAGLIEDYARVRLAYTVAAREAEVAPLLTRTNALQTEIWALTTDVARRSPTPISASLVASLNEMFDASQAQRFAYGTHVPASLRWTLFGGSLLAVGAMGFQLGATGNRQIVLSILSLFMWAGAMVLIQDLDRARSGSIHIDPAPTIQGFSPGAQPR